MIYLDNAATTFPKPKGMIGAMSKCMNNYCGNPGRSGHGFSIKTGEEVYKARKNLADLFDIEDPSRIIFGYNATDMLNMAIKGVVEPGDHVITTAMEHNSVLRPLKALKDQGAELSILKCNWDGCVNPESVAKEIRSNTKLIVCTHASNVTGTIMPIQEIGKIARKNGILFLVDAAQTAGCVPIDVNKMRIDMLAVPGHKGLLGPLGTGFLYVREGISLKPLKEGGTGTESKNLNQPEDFPEGYESGTINAPGIIGLGYSAEYIKSIGVDRIRMIEDSALKILDGGLRKISGVTIYGPEDTQRKTGIVTFNIAGIGCEEAAAILNQDYGIAVRSGFHCAGLAHKTIGTWETGAVRMSIGPFTTKTEIREAVRAVRNIADRINRENKIK